MVQNLFRKLRFLVAIVLRIFAIFRPPFINGRPQDSDSVFGKRH